MAWPNAGWHAVRRDGETRRGSKNRRLPSNNEVKELHFLPSTLSVSNVSCDLRFHASSEDCRHCARATPWAVDQFYLHALRPSKRCLFPMGFSHEFGPPKKRHPREFQGCAMRSGFKVNDDLAPGLSLWFSSAFQVQVPWVSAKLMKTTHVLAKRRAGETSIWPHHVMKGLLYNHLISLSFRVTLV